MFACLLVLEKGQIFKYSRICPCLNIGKIFGQYLDFTKNICSGVVESNGKCM